MAFPLTRSHNPYPPAPQDFARDGPRWAAALVRALQSNEGIAVQGFLQGVRVVSPGTYPYSITSSDVLVLVDTTAVRVINLPPAVARFCVQIKDSTGGAGANNITVNAVAGQTIEGAASYAMTVARQSISVVGTGVTGSEWVVI